MTAVLAPAAFDVCGPLPTDTTVLEASAGTGKTFTIAALAARYDGEGVATLPELMLVTFGREATTELRERVRARLSAAQRALADPAAARAGGDAVHALLAAQSDAQLSAVSSPLHTPSPHCAVGSASSARASSHALRQSNSEPRTSSAVHSQRSTSLQLACTKHSVAQNVPG